MPKINETTNDKMKGAPSQNSGGRPRVVAAHEPLKDEISPPNPPWPAFPVSIPIPVQQPVQAAQPAPLKVALVGTAPSSRLLAPYSDTSWTIWGCSPGNMGIMPRVDAWFEIHGNLLWPEYKHYGEPYLEWLKKQTFPIYMQDQSLIPQARVFPKAELVRVFGRSFFTSTFAWMMAFAIYSKATEIALYGVDMASRDEYILQRPGFYFFQHMAETRGIKVSAPNESDIMMPPGLYGYSDITPFGRKAHARRREIRDRIAQLEAQKQQIIDSLNHLRGADEDIDYFLSIWGGAQDNSAEL